MVGDRDWISRWWPQGTDKLHSLPSPPIHVSSSPSRKRDGRRGTGKRFQSISSSYLFVTSSVFLNQYNILITLLSSTGCFLNQTSRPGMANDKWCWEMHPLEAPVILDQGPHWSHGPAHFLTWPCPLCQLSSLFSACTPEVPQDRSLSFVITHAGHQSHHSRPHHPYEVFWDTPPPSHLPQNTQHWSSTYHSVSPSLIVSSVKSLDSYLYSLPNAESNNKWLLNERFNCLGGRTRKYDFFSILITTVLQGWHDLFSHVRKQGQRCLVTCPESHSREGAERGFESKSAWLPKPPFNPLWWSEDWLKASPTHTEHHQGTLWHFSVPGNLQDSRANTTGHPCRDLRWVPDSHRPAPP